MYLLVTDCNLTQSLFTKHVCVFLFHMRAIFHSFFACFIFLILVLYKILCIYYMFHTIYKDSFLDIFIGTNAKGSKNLLCKR